MYKIELSKESLKYLQKLDNPTREKVLEAIKSMPEGDIKKLTGSSYYRLRVGDFRIVFEKNNMLLKIQIIKIAPRGEVYKK